MGARHVNGASEASFQTFSLHVYVYAMSSLVLPDT
jgi:hypothetical protein